MARRERMPVVRKQEKRETLRPKEIQKEHKQGEALSRLRELLVHRLQQKGIGRALRALGIVFALSEQTGCATMQVRAPETDRIAVEGAEPFEAEHPSVEVMRRELLRAVGQEGMRELLPELPQRSAQEARTSVERLQNERRTGIQGWEHLYLDPEQAELYFSMGFPAGYFSPVIAQARWRARNENLPCPTTGVFVYEGSSSFAPGDAPSEIMLFTQANCSASLEAIPRAVNVVTHEFAHARDPYSAPTFISEEARVTFWWRVHRLLQNPDHPRTAYTESMEDREDFHAFYGPRLHEYVAELERVVFETTLDPVPDHEPWEQYKARTVAERFRCSPAAGLRAVRLVQYWASQFQTPEEAESFDWAQAERVRQAALREMVSRRLNSEVHDMMNTLTDIQLQEELLAHWESGFRQGEALTEADESSLRTLSQKVHSALRIREEAYERFRSLYQAAQRSGAPLRVLQSLLEKTAQSIKQYQDAWSRLSQQDMTQVHAYVAQEGRLRRVQRTTLSHEGTS